MSKTVVRQPCTIFTLSNTGRVKRGAVHISIAWFVALRGKITDRAIRSSCIARRQRLSQWLNANTYLREEKILLKDIIISFVGHDGSPSDCYNLLWQWQLFGREVEKKPVRTCSVAVGCVKQTRLSISSKQQINQCPMATRAPAANKSRNARDDGRRAPPKSITGLGFW